MSVFYITKYINKLLDDYDVHENDCWIVFRI